MRSMEAVVCGGEPFTRIYDARACFVRHDGSVVAKAVADAGKAVERYRWLAREFPSAWPGRVDAGVAVDARTGKEVAVVLMPWCGMVAVPYMEPVEKHLIMMEVVRLVLTMTPKAIGVMEEGFEVGRVWGEDGRLVVKVLTPRSFRPRPVGMGVAAVVERNVKLVESVLDRRLGCVVGVSEALERATAAKDAAAAVAGLVGVGEALAAWVGGKGLVEEAWKQERVVAEAARIMDGIRVAAAGVEVGGLL